MGVSIFESRSEDESDQSKATNRRIVMASKILGIFRYGFPLTMAHGPTSRATKTRAFTIVPSPVLT